MKRQNISILELQRVEEKTSITHGLTASEINDTRKLLNAIQQEVPLLDSCLIKSILCIRTISFQYSCYFINLAMQLPSCNEPR